jgi:hypothetical protein
MRILVTGSRDWEDRELIWHTLNELVSDSVGHFLVHGDCPTSADRMADEWAACQPDIIVEKYRAGWDVYGKAGGPIRNKYMVSLGADVCLAFIKNNSKGATGTMHMAEDAGIRVELYRV